MIRLAVSERSERLRSEFRAWVAKNPPPQIARAHDFSEFVEVARAWQKRLASARWLGVHWPEKHGGRGLSLVEEAVVQEELARAAAPQVLGLFGLTMVGPVLIQHGTEKQRDRYLAKILSAEEIWCQGFSEPGAGSDLAAIATRAAPVAGGFKVTGQKVWTSFAHVADWCFALCRTSDEGAKHRGLTYLLIDMRSPGISTRPLTQITGDREFNEVFFDEVFVPSENVVGEVGQGWKIAISTLMYERVVLTFARQLQSEALLRELIGRYGDDPAYPYRRELCSEIARAAAVRALSYEHLLAYAGGKVPGPEGSLDKLFWSESFQRITQLALRSAGAEAERGETDPAVGSFVHRYLYSRGRTIAAGTSEIQRGIIAERVLGLPRLETRAS